MAKPIRVQRMSIRKIPAQKAALPRHFCLRAKKRKVRCGPRSNVIPTRKRMLPMARRARSKKRIRPKTRKKKPTRFGQRRLEVHE